MARDSAAGAQIKVTSILGRGESKVSSQNVSGGRVFVLLGSGDIDLRQAALAEGEAEIRIAAVLGRAGLPSRKTGGSTSRPERSWVALMTSVPCPTRLQANSPSPAFASLEE